MKRYNMWGVVSVNSALFAQCCCETNCLKNNSTKYILKNVKNSGISCAAIIEIP